MVLESNDIGVTGAGGALGSLTSIAWDISDASSMWIEARSSAGSSCC
jgi:hypothetical protein